MQDWDDINKHKNVPLFGVKRKQFYIDLDLIQRINSYRK